ncbi:MAG TPA: hypothetical protein VMT72_10485 [Pseudolabrys sp.]|nr:hypothetical protein [Pseudolabrys sp.]
MLSCGDFDTLANKAKEYRDMLALMLSGPPLSPEQKKEARLQCAAMIRMIAEVIEHIEEKETTASK